MRDTLLLVVSAVYEYSFLEYAALTMTHLHTKARKDRLSTKLYDRMHVLGDVTLRGELVLHTLSNFM